MGTTVPINQYVETIYVNTMGAFSTETVRAVIENANLDFKDIGGSTVYYLAANLSDGMALIIFKSNTNDYAILWGNFSQGQWLYSSKAELTPDNFVGWNKSFEGIINFVGNNFGNEDTILGTQNELLKGLFSITPFEKRVNRVFLNTNMTVDEVKTTAAQLITGSDVAYAVFFKEPKGIVILLQGGEVMIIYSNDEQEEKCIFSSASNELTNFGFEGWDPEFNGAITFKTELFEGCQNDVVKNLINTYPFDLSLGKVFSNIANGIRTKLGQNEEKWNGDSGTPVPVGENVEKVYFNYEYDPILINTVFKKLTFTTNTNLSSAPFYVVYANATLTRVIVIFDQGYTLGQKSYLLSVMDFTGASGLPDYDIYSYPAFEDDLKDVGYIELNEVGISESLGVTAGAQNELLKDIISITPFVKKPTYVIEPYNMSYEIDDIKDSAKVVTKVIKGDKIPNDGTEFNGIYFNTALSIEEVVKKIENMTFSMEDTLGLTEIVLYATDSSGEDGMILAAGYEDGAWFILDILTQFPFFVSKDVNGAYGFEGWNLTLNSTNGAFIGNVTLTTKSSLTMEGITIPVGNQNEYLSDLIAITPFEERETYTELSGEYDGSTIQVTENQEVDVLELAKESKLPAKIEVNVLIPEDYIKPSGELEITENAVYNIREYETVNVNGASSGAVVKGILSNTVPNNGEIVADLYFNTDLTNEEVDQFITSANLTYQDYNDQQVYGILADGVGYALYGILNFGGAYAIVKLNIATGNVTDIIYCSTALQSTFGTSGWKSTLNLSTSYSVGSVTSLDEALGYPIGLENDKLLQLVSSTAIRKVEKQLTGEYGGNFAIINDCESNVVNISNMLENNKLPLEIEVNNNSNLIKFLEGGKIDSLEYKSTYNHVRTVLFRETNIDKIKISFYTAASISLDSMCFYRCKASTIHICDKLKGDGGYRPLSLAVSSDNLTSNHFYGCENLKALLLDVESFSEISEGSTITFEKVFGSTPIAEGTGYIYVPDDLVDSVKAMNFWSDGASQIKPISEYVEE